MGGVCARVRDKRNAYRILVGKPEGKRQFVGRWFKMGGSDKMELKERRWKMVSWINMARDRRKVAGCCEHGDELRNYKLWGISRLAEQLLASK